MPATHRIPAYALVLALVSWLGVAAGAAASDEKKQQPARSATEAEAPALTVTTAAPDLVVQVHADGTVGIRNTGFAAGGPLAVRLSCTPKASRTGTPPGCGNPFNGQRIRAGGTAVLNQTYDLPLGGGSNVYPIKLQPGSSTVSQSGPGWIMIYPATPTWLPGSYELSAEVDVQNAFQESNETNNAAKLTIQLP